MTESPQDRAQQAAVAMVTAALSGVREGDLDGLKAARDDILFIAKPLNDAERIVTMGALAAIAAGMMTIHFGDDAQDAVQDLAKMINPDWRDL